MKFAARILLLAGLAGAAFGLTTQGPRQGIVDAPSSLQAHFEARPRDPQDFAPFGSASALSPKFQNAITALVPVLGGHSGPPQIAMGISTIVVRSVNGISRGRWVSHLCIKPRKRSEFRAEFNPYVDAMRLLFVGRSGHHCAPAYISSRCRFAMGKKSPMVYINLVAPAGFGRTVFDGFGEHIFYRSARASANPSNSRLLVPVQDIGAALYNRKPVKRLANQLVKGHTS